MVCRDPQHVGEVKMAFPELYAHYEYGTPMTIRGGPFKKIIVFVSPEAPHTVKYWVEHYSKKWLAADGKVHVI
jgi:hypothetical protein